MWQLRWEFVEFPAPYLLKGALYLTVDTRVAVEVGIHRVSHSLFIKRHLFPYLAPINSPFLISFSLLHFSHSKLLPCHAFIYVFILQPITPLFPRAQSKSLFLPLLS